MASHRERIMEKTRKFQVPVVYAGPTNLCPHSTTDLARGIMTNEHIQYAVYNLLSVLGADLLLSVHLGTTIFSLF